MYLDLLARIVLSSSMCSVLFICCLQFSIGQCGCISFCSLRVVLLPRTSLNSSSFLLAFTRCVSTLSLYAFIRACRGSLSIIVLIRSRHSLFCRSSMRRQRCTSPGNLQFDREPRRVPTTRGILLAQKPLGRLSTTILGNGGVSTQQLPFCHGVPHTPSQFVASHASLSGGVAQLLPRTTPL